ncbi:MAG: hypothetical protein Q9219_006011 [cf. Caloplaca sp. 3 TL-2023]
MKVPVNVGKQIHPFGRSGSMRLSNFNDYSDSSDGDQLTEPIKPEPDEHQPTKVDRPSPSTFSPNGPLRKIIEVYTDRAGLPGCLTIKVAQDLAPKQQLLLDAIIPLLNEPLEKPTGIITPIVCNLAEHLLTNPTPVFSSVERNCNSHRRLLSSGGGLARNNKSQNILSHRLKRCRPNPSIAPGKRPRSSSTFKSERSTCTPPVTASRASTAISTADRGDGHNNGDSDSDDGEPVVFEEERDRLYLNDTEGIADFYVRCCQAIGQFHLKLILKAWIKVKEPSKQVRHPYNGGRNPSGDPDNKGHNTAPEWWPSQDHWQLGLGCRHREPDHVGRRGDFTLQRLRDATDIIDLIREKKEILEEMYDVREQEQRYEQGESGGDTMIYVRKPKPRKANKKRKKRLVRQVNRSRRARGGTIESSGQLAFAEQTATTGAPGEISSEQLPSAEQTAATRDIYTPLTPACSPVTVKSEHENLIQPSLPPSSGLSLSEDMFHTMTPAANVDFSVGGVVDASNHGFQNDGPSLIHQNLPLLQAAPECAPADPPHVGTENYPLPIVTSSTRLPIRNNLGGYPRAASVMRNESPSYTQAWPSQMDQHDFNDDMSCTGYRMPITSFGRPLINRPIPINAPNSHPHGQPPHIQQAICAEHNCPFSHPHGWRPREEQEDLCARSGCQADPRSFPMVFGRSTQQLRNQQLYNMDSNNFPAPGSLDFNVHRSFP